MTTALLFDSETNRKENPEIVEAAWVFLPADPTREFNPAPESVECVRLMPSSPIELGAMAAHGITEEDLVGCDPSSMFELPPCDFLIGHNVDFDWIAAGSPSGLKRICTLALARAVWPDLDCHTQSALTRGAHGASCDVLLCHTILYAIIRETGATSWMELWERSEKARIPAVMPFGKHRGELIKDVPQDYKRWLLGQPDVDDYLRIALGGQPKDKTLL